MEIFWRDGWNFRLATSDLAPGGDTGEVIQIIS